MNDTFFQGDCHEVDGPVSVQDVCTSLRELAVLRSQKLQLSILKELHES